MERKTNHSLVYSAFALPLILYYFFIVRYSVNMPFSDDIQTILSFIFEYTSTLDAGQKLLSLFSLCNEHRIAFNKLVTVAYYGIFGSLDFKMLILTGNIGLAFSALALFLSSSGGQNEKTAQVRSARKQNIFIPMIFLPVMFILFQPQAALTIYWATTALEHLWVLFFALFSLYLLVSKKRSYSFPLSLLFAAAASFTDGNGMLVFPAGVITLLLCGRKKRALIFGIAGAALIASYFIGYNGSVTSRVAAGSLLYAPAKTASFFFLHVGSIFDLFGSASLPAAYRLAAYLLLGLAGAAACAYFVVLFRKEYYRRNPVLFAFYIFLLLTALELAVLRSNFGAEQALNSRYRMIPAFILAVIYLSFMDISAAATKKKIFPVLLALSVLFCATSYFKSYDEIYFHYSNRLLGLVEWESTKDKKQPDETGRIVERAIIQGTYRIPKIDIYEFTAAPVKISLPEPSRELLFAIEQEKRRDTLIAEFNGWVLIKAVKEPADRVYIVLSSGAVTYSFACKKIRRPDVEAYFGKKGLDRTGFNVKIHELPLKKGRYKVGICISKGNTSLLQFDETLTIAVD